MYYIATSKLYNKLMGGNTVINPFDVVFPVYNDKENQTIQT